jgi:hypothetical protein
MERQDLLKKGLAAAVLIALLSMFLLMLRGNEDTWVCVAGVWAKHGHPQASMPPASECK